MTPKQITLPPDIVADIASRSGAAYPNEACGLLIGVRDQEGLTATKSIPCVNAHKVDTARRFAIAPSDLFAVHRKARDMGQAVIGHYHSHPGGAAKPSDTDALSIADPQVAWLIQSITASGQGDLRAFYPAEDSLGFKSLALRVAAP